MVWWHILAGLLLGATAIVLTIALLDEKSLKEEMKIKGLKQAIVTAISNGNRVKFDALDQYDNKVDLEVETEKINTNDIYVGAKITV